MAAAAPVTRSSLTVDSDLAVYSPGGTPRAWCCCYAVEEGWKAARRAGDATDPAWR